jgi:hypothetical protein
MKTLTYEYVSECLRYDPDTGKLYWLERNQSHFKDVRALKVHRTSKAGKVAGCFDKSTGYLVIGINYKILYAHRLAWLLTHGTWPSGMIDHINGDKTDNRLENLRSVSQFENAKNARLSRNNKSGTPGVSLDKRSGKWRARIMSNYREVYARSFSTKDEAIAARKEAQVNYGFHENHGRKAWSAV